MSPVNVSSVLLSISKKRGEMITSVLMDLLYVFSVVPSILSSPPLARQAVQGRLASSVGIAG